MKLSTPISIRSAVVTLVVTAAVGTAQGQEASTGAGSGQAAFNNNCRTCHSVKEGDNRMGPSLSRIVGAKSGTREGYPNYSQAMKTASVTWDEQTLDRFIENPEQVVPNNNMKPYKGVPDAQVRKSIVEYLKGAAGKP